MSGFGSSAARFYDVSSSTVAPGPGAYSVKHPTQMGVSAPAVSIKGRIHDAVDQHIPGPGEYSPSPFHQIARVGSSPFVRKNNRHICRRKNCGCQKFLQNDFDIKKVRELVRNNEDEEKMFQERLKEEVEQEQQELENNNNIEATIEEQKEKIVEKLLRRISVERFHQENNIPEEELENTENEDDDVENQTTSQNKNVPAVLPACTPQRPKKTSQSTPTATPRPLSSLAINSDLNAKRGGAGVSVISASKPITSTPQSSKRMVPRKVLQTGQTELLSSPPNPTSPVALVREIPKRSEEDEKLLQATSVLQQLAFDQYNNSTPQSIPFSEYYQTFIQSFLCSHTTLQSELSSSQCTLADLNSELSLRSQQLSAIQILLDQSENREIFLQKELENKVLQTEEQICRLSNIIKINEEEKKNMNQRLNIAQVQLSKIIEWLGLKEKESLVDYWIERDDDEEFLNEIKLMIVQKYGLKEELLNNTGGVVGRASEVFTSPHKRKLMRTPIKGQGLTTEMVNLRSPLRIPSGTSSSGSSGTKNRRMSGLLPPNIPLPASQSSLSQSSSDLFSLNLLSNSFGSSNNLTAVEDKDDEEEEEVVDEKQKLLKGRMSSSRCAYNV